MYLDNRGSHQTLTIRADEFSTYAIAYKFQGNRGNSRAVHRLNSTTGTVREGRWMQNDIRMVEQKPGRAYLQYNGPLRLVLLDLARGEDG